MATTTPNYGWTVPTSTDLVKDGATAIETLGDAIDASMNTALGTKKAGMVLLNTTSFSAVASQSINDVFSANYDNYLIKANFTSSVDCTMSLRYRVSGADNSTSNYNTQRVVFSDTVVTAARTLSGTSHQITSNNTNLYVLDCYVTRPFLTTTTQLQTSTGNGGAIQLSGCGFAATTSFTGFTLIPSTGTITGDIFVYGFND